MYSSYSFINNFHDNCKISSKPKVSCKLSKKSYCCHVKEVFWVWLKLRIFREIIDKHEDWITRYQGIKYCDLENKSKWPILWKISWQETAYNVSWCRYYFDHWKLFSGKFKLKRLILFKICYLPHQTNTPVINSHQ